MNQAYINAYLHIEPSIYGIKLKPLTLGHAILLDYIHSPCFTGAEVKREDLITAVYFLSKPFADGLKSLSNLDELKKDIAKTVKPNGYLFKYEFEAFKKYLSFYMKFPRRWDNGQAKDAKVPWQFSILFMLLERFTEAEIMDMPITKAMCFCACFENAQGESNLAGMDQSELLDKWEAEEKEEMEVIANV